MLICGAGTDCAGGWVGMAPRVAGGHAGCLRAVDRRRAGADNRYRVYGRDPGSAGGG